MCFVREKKMRIINSECLDCQVRLLSNVPLTTGVEIVSRVRELYEMGTMLTTPCVAGEIDCRYLLEAAVCNLVTC